MSIQELSTFGEFIRNLREEKSMPIRKVAALIDIDPSTLSKIERSERFANKDLIRKLAAVFEMPYDEMYVNFVSDKVAQELIRESKSRSEDILRMAELKVKYLMNQMVRQGEISFERND
ncbi:MAG: helix-turn-helix transcriptional regulator [Bacteroidota bacterium]